MSSSSAPLNPGKKTALENVVAAMNRIAPLSLADSSWDNVGTLLESPVPREGAENVFLAIDLTTAVTDELLSDPSLSVAVIYHPIIFRGLKSITLKDSQQRSLLRCAAAGVSIYCPHTSLDACSEGINHWMKESVRLDEGETFKSRPIVPTKIEGEDESVGMGHYVERDPVSLADLIPNIKKHFGVSHIQVARPIASRKISTVAFCAGSGSGVFSGVTADLFITGELSHHEVLSYIAKGSYVILLNHTNSERGYLKARLAPKLKKELKELGVEADVKVSVKDKDPLVVE